MKLHTAFHTEHALASNRAITFVNKQQQKTEQNLSIEHFLFYEQKL